MLSLLNIPFKLLMNILTIINSVIIFLLLIIAYYIYINKKRFVKYVKEILSDLIINLKRKRNKNKNILNYNRAPFNPFS